MNHVYGDPNTRSLYEAASYGYTDRLGVLLNEGADVNELTEGWTPLHTAASAGQAEATRILLEHGAEPNARDDYGFTPLLLAMRYGLQHDPDAETVRHLVQRGAWINLSDLFPDLDEPWGESPLILAATEGNLAAIKLLVEAGARINDPTYEGTTPLIAAIVQGDANCVRYLLQHGADVNVRPRNGWSALKSAIHKGNNEIVDLLRKAGAQ